MRPRAGRNFRRNWLKFAEKRLLRLLLRVSLSMPKREAQGKYVPCENASGAEFREQGLRETEENDFTENVKSVIFVFVFLKLNDR